MSHGGGAARIGADEAYDVTPFLAKADRNVIVRDSLDFYLISIKTH